MITSLKSWVYGIPKAKWMALVVYVLLKNINFLVDRLMSTALMLQTKINRRYSAHKIRYLECCHRLVLECILSVKRAIKVAAGKYIKRLKTILFPTNGRVGITSNCERFGWCDVENDANGKEELGVYPDAISYEHHVLKVSNAIPYYGSSFSQSKLWFKMSIKMVQVKATEQISR